METSTEVTPGAAFGTPEWVRDAVFYQIFPDRFARSLAVPKPNNLEAWDSPPTIHGFKGGDLLGVADHLDYLADLGVTAIYFCPVFRSTANHRYHTHDYYEIDPILGGDAAFDTLVAEAHGRGIRVILDGVFNHCGRGFFEFNHILENGAASPYIDWFSVYSWPLLPYGPGDQPAGYAAWWNDRALPKFNTNTQDVREFLWRVGEYWVDRGVDGWRLDVPNEIDDDDFWREFRRRVKRSNPDAYIVGEIWGDARRWLAGDQFDAVMNYMFTKACLGFFTNVRGMEQSMVRGSGLDPVEPLDGFGFAGAIEGLLGLYSWESTLSQLNLLDSHDTSRFLSIARGDESALKLAVLFQMTYPGAPCTYYGDEIGMTGGGSNEEARWSFPWEKDRWNTSLLEHVKACIALRREHEVLRRGGYASIHVAQDCYVFTRQLGSDVAVVALNVAAMPRTLDIDARDGTRFTGLQPVFGNGPEESGNDSIRGWMVPGRSGAVLVGKAV